MPSSAKSPTRSSSLQPPPPSYPPPAHAISFQRKFVSIKKAEEDVEGSELRNGSPIMHTMSLHPAKDKRRQENGSRAKGMASPESSTKASFSPTKLSLADLSINRDVVGKTQRQEEEAKDKSILARAFEDPKVQRVIMFSELPAVEKKKYSQFLVAHDIKCSKLCGDYVYADIDLSSSPPLAAARRASGAKASTSGENLSPSATFPQEETDLSFGLESTKEESETAKRLKATYSQFCTMVQKMQSLETLPKPKPYTWLLATIQEVYESLYAKLCASADSQELGQLELEFHGTATSGKSEVETVPELVFQHMCKKYGLKPLISRACWELIVTLDKYLQENQQPKIRRFHAMLKGDYRPRDVQFFLRIREECKKQLAKPSTRRPSSSQRLRKGSSREDAKKLTYGDYMAINKAILGPRTSSQYYQVLLELEQLFARDMSMEAMVEDFFHVALSSHRKHVPDSNQ